MCGHPPFQYEFALRDRLGSTRIMLKDRYFDARDVFRGSSGFFEPEVLQVNDYYPFGLNHETNKIRAPAPQLFKIQNCRSVASNTNSKFL